MSERARDWQQELQAMSKQYLDAWQDMARQAASAMPGNAAAWAGTPAPAWQNWFGLFDPAARAPWPRGAWPGAPTFSAAAPGLGMPGFAAGAPGGVDAMLERFSTQARQLLGFLHSLASGAQGEGSAAEVSRAWRDVLAGQGAGPVLDAMRSFVGPGARGFEQMMEGLQPMLAPLRGELQSMLSLPTFGLAREHQERWQALAAAQVEYQEAFNRYQALLLRAGENAFSRFEDKLAEHSEPGRQIDSVRGLFDLWIDAAEEAYAEIALGEDYRHAFGALANAQLRLRQSVQQEVERAGLELGMPSRSEVDSAHQRVHALERELRQLRRRLADIEGGGPTSRKAERSSRAAADDQDDEATPQRRAASPRKSGGAAKKSPARKSANAKSSRAARPRTTRKAAASAAPRPSTRTARAAPAPASSPNVPKAPAHAGRRGGRR